MTFSVAAPPPAQTLPPGTSPPPPPEAADAEGVEPTLMAALRRAPAGAAVSSAEDTARASAEVEAAISFILAGLRQQAESGVELPGPADLVPDASPVIEGDARG